MNFRFFVTLMTATAVPALLHAEVIGNVAAANEQVVGTPPAADPRLLGLGLEIFADERVETSSVGSGQFLFLDQTSLTVWPDSEVVLDSYVYDPERGVGEMAISVGRGVLRFIGGRISKTDEVRIRTPHAVVAVRGGIAQIEVSAERTTALHVAGDFTRLDPLDGSAPVTLARPNALGIAEAGGASFAGIADSETVRQAWSRQPGVGNGGAPAPVTPAVTDPLIETAGIDALGSGDATAPTAQPVSTSGEQEQETSEAPLEEIEAEIESETGETQLAQEADDVLADPDENPAPGFDVPSNAVSLTGFTGIFSSTQDGNPATAFGEPIEDPASQNIAWGPPTDQVALTNFFAAPDDNSSTGRRIFGFSQDGTTDVELVEIPGLSFEFGNLADPAEGPTAAGRPANAARFVSPGVFYASFLETIDGDPARINFDVFGRPTPSSFYEQQATADIEVRSYDLSANLFATQFDDLGNLLQVYGDPLPEPTIAAFDGDPFDIDPRLFLVSEPNSPLLPEPGSNGRTKWLLSYVTFQGAGRDQISAHGVMTRRALTTPLRHPALDGFMALTVSLDAAQPPSLAFVNQGTPVTADGAVTYGPNAEYFVLSDVRVEGADNDVTVSRASDFSQWSYNPADERFEAYGMSRVAVLDETITVPDAARIIAARPASESWIFDPAINPPAQSLNGGSIPDGRFQQVFDGGYAAIAAFGQVTSPDRQVNPPYLLRTNTPDDVRFGFNAARNSAVGEFGDSFDDQAGEDTDGFVLAAGTTTAPLTIAPALNINWGNTVSGDVLLTDRAFFARSAFEVEGYLTGQEPRLFGKLGRPNITTQEGEIEQRAWLGSLSTAVETPEPFDNVSAVHNSGANAPAYLRWGWWSGEYRQDQDDADPDFRNRRDRMHVGAWVTGVQSDISAVRNATGTAQYSGFAVANVLETPSGADVPFAYVDDAAVTMQYDFGQRDGSISIDGIAGTGFVASLSEDAATNAGVFPGAGAYPRTNHYAGAIQDNSTITNVTGSIQGAFFSGAGDPVAATAGGFDFDGTRASDGARIQAAGVYAAEK